MLSNPRRPSTDICHTSAALMYVLVPMPCLFFGGGSTQFLTSRDGGGYGLICCFRSGNFTIHTVLLGCKLTDVKNSLE